MFGQRAPWWMYLLAASYLGCAAVVFYVEFRGPEDLGIEFPSLLTPGPAVAGAIDPDSPAARAGIEPGDRIVDFEGHPITSALHWGLTMAEVEGGHLLHLGIERRGERREVVLTLQRRSTGPGDAADWVRLARAMLALGLAVLIAFSRPNDLQARIGALLLGEVALAGLFFLRPLPGLAAAIRDLPGPLALLVQAPLASPGGALLFAFAAIFPRPLFRGAWAWTLVWFPQLAMMAVRGYAYIYMRGAQTEHAQRVPRWIIPAGVVYLIATAVVFLLNYRRLEDRNERRRARVVAAGTVVLIVAVLPYVVMLYPGAAVPRLDAFFFSPSVFVTLNLLTAAFPLSIAYAILRHRAFDISVVIRQGLKYAVARRTLVALLPILGAILAADLLLHGDRPLGAILRERGWIYAAIAGAALLARGRQRVWMEALDRRFFREQYDAQRLLREVAEQVREAASFEDAAPRVAAQIEAALHSEFAAVLIHRPRDASYTVVAAAPPGALPPALPAESKLLNMIRVLGKPVELTLTETGWLKQQLPHEETHFLRQSRIEWLIPIAPASGCAEALLAVGFKRSEEPYTREDQDLLLAIAASMSLLLERPAAARAPVEEAFEECPACGLLYDAGAARCSVEGATLSLVRLPRLLAGRYRLDRWQGGGGMGTVYAATDTALERRVAVKVMREDIAGNPGAAERFRREARTAAAFSHPNVVTVHDFGVAAASRAFLVMELLEGVDLRGELKQKQRLAAHRVVEVLRGVCAALEAAHGRGLTHRDIKPENIFLARSGGIEVPKVLDFGIAKFVSASAPALSMTATATGHLVGTPRYMSPEQLRGDSAAESWDLWALGVLAYEMLAGHYPFEGASHPEWQAAAMAGRFTPLCRSLPSAPSEWDKFFERALAADPARRPGGAGEFLSELEKALAHAS